MEGWAVFAPDQAAMAAAVRVVLEREPEPHGVRPTGTTATTSSS